MKLKTRYHDLEKMIDGYSYSNNHLFKEKKSHLWILKEEFIYDDGLFFPMFEILIKDSELDDLCIEFECDGWMKIQTEGLQYITFNDFDFYLLCQIQEYVIDKYHQYENNYNEYIKNKYE